MELTALNYSRYRKQIVCKVIIDLFYIDRLQLIVGICFDIKPAKHYSSPRKYRDSCVKTITL